MQEADIEPVSAIAHQPRRALAGVSVRVGLAPLALLVSVSTAVRIVCAWLRPTPDYFPDEYMYASFARSLAGGHLPAVRGVSAHFLPLLQPLVTAPAWLLPNVEDGYRATQAIEALAMSLAAVPVYYLARQVGLGSRHALAAAALSLTIPALVYSSFVLSEPVAYPVALGAVAAAVRALDRPSVRSFALFLALAAAAMFTRMQFAILIPCFVVALAAVVVRERRFRAFIASHRIAVGLLLVVSGVLFALGPARNTGYYPSFTNTPGFKMSDALGLLAPDALVLVFAGGFVLAPGALLGVVYAVARPLRRAELAFGALTVALTVGLLAEAIVYGHPNYVQGTFLGHTDYVQERYLFYLLPLWTIAFLLYAQRGWPRKGLYAVAAVALVVGSLRLPLAGNIVADRFAHSPFLFALRRLAEMVQSAPTASLIVVLAGAVATLAILGIAFVTPRGATIASLAFAGAATIAASAGAVSLNVRDTRALADSVLAGHPSWVDDSQVGNSTMVLLPGSESTDLILFWNRSLDRLALLPGAGAVDSFSVQNARVARDGTLLIDGSPAHGNLLLSTQSTTVVLQTGRVTGTTTGTVSVHAPGRVRLRLMMFGRYADGWLRGKGYVRVWPTSATGGVNGRIVVPIRPLREGSRVKITFSDAGGRTVTRSVSGDRTTNVAIPVCSKGPAMLFYQASPLSYLPDGRIVAATAGKPRFVPGGC
jgi:hypothetical protein